MEFHSVTPEKEDLSGRNFACRIGALQPMLGAIRQQIPR